MMVSGFAKHMRESLSAKRGLVSKLSQPIVAYSQLQYNAIVGFEPQGEKKRPSQVSLVFSTIVANIESLESHLSTYYSHVKPTSRCSINSVVALCCRMALEQTE